MNSQRSLPLVAALSALVALSACVAPGNPTGSAQFGPEVQVYPAGAILGGRYELPAGERTVQFARLAVNLTDRGSWGQHDDEQGHGFGGGIGMRRWLDQQGIGWHYGARADIWSLSLDWEDRAPARSGDSKVLVLQPAIEGGYSWWNRGGRIDLSLSLGVEVNVDTRGEDVGEGPILLLGVSLFPGYADPAR